MSNKLRLRRHNLLYTILSVCVFGAVTLECQTAAMGGLLVEDNHTIRSSTVHQVSLKITNIGTDVEKDLYLFVKGHTTGDWGGMFYMGQGLWKELTEETPGFVTARTIRVPGPLAAIAADALPGEQGIAYPCFSIGTLYPNASENVQFNVIYSDVPGLPTTTSWQIAEGRITRQQGNQPPTGLRPQRVNTRSNTAADIMLRATDPDGDALTFTVVDSPAHGTLIGDAPDLTYVPEPDYAGYDVFAFQVEDAQGNMSAIQVVYISIAPSTPQSSSLPIADGQSVETTMGEALDLTLYATDPDGDALTFVIIGPPAHGTLSGNPPEVTYSPDPEYAGNDSFTFVAYDEKGLCSYPATVNIAIKSHDAGNWTTLSAPGASATEAWGIDGSNIVGNYTDASGTHGFLFDGSNWITLDAPDAASTYACDIDGNNIVGWYTDSTYSHTFGFLYDGSTWTTLAVDWWDTLAQGIGGDKIVGCFYYEYSIMQAFLNEGDRWDYPWWDYPDAPEASQAEAWDVYGSTIVGCYNDSLGAHGFVHDGSNWITLDMPTGLATWAHGFDGTNIVGTYVDAFGRHGFLYDGSAWITLDVSDASRTEAYGVDGDSVVGKYIDQNGATHGFLYLP